MQWIKKGIMSIFLLLMGSAAFGGLLLFLTPKQGAAAWLVATVLLAGVVIISAFRFKRNRKQGSNSAALLLLLGTVLSVWLVALVLAIGNLLLYEVEEYMTENTKLTAAQKLDYVQHLAKGKQAEIDLENLEKMQKAGMTFYSAKGSDSAEVIEEIVASTKKLQREYNLLLGGKTDAPVSVILYSGELEMPQRESIQQQYNGFYNQQEQTIHLPMPLGNSVWAHEYMHHQFLNIADERGIYGTEIPEWFSEGLAVAISEKGHSVSYTDLRDTEYVEFQDLEQYGEWENRLNPPTNPYFQSGSFVRYVLEREGDQFVSKVFKEMERSSFQESFLQATGKTVDEYEAAFIKDFAEIPVLWEQAHRMEVGKGDHVEALALFLEIEAIMPTLELVNHRIANLYMETGHYEKAVSYRKTEVALAIAEERPTLPDAYGYLAGSLLFTDVSSAIGAAEQAVAASLEETSGWHKGTVEELEELEMGIASGRHFDAYLSLLSGEYVIGNGLYNPNLQINLIEKVLLEYPDNNSPARFKLIAMKQRLETEMENH